MTGNAEMWLTMRHDKFFRLLLLPFLVLMACGSSPGSHDAGTGKDVGGSHEQPAGRADSVCADTACASQSSCADIPVGARALIEAYPDFITGYSDGKIYFNDGTSAVYDDGENKDFETMLNNSDLEDMFYTRYVQPATGESPEYLADAGRSRNDVLFKKMYGNSAAAVQKNLVSVSWFGQTVKFTSVNGAADRLRKVADELAQHPEYRKYLKSSGTFYWRQVRGAKRMSAHSYGIAFDIGVDHSDYWLWRNAGAKETTKIRYANRIPHEIADIFRKHGFIWGGSWYHFDTMHFEYRPEILRYAELTAPAE